MNLLHTDLKGLDERPLAEIDETVKVDLSAHRFQ